MAVQQIEAMFALATIVVGLSHFFRARQWCDAFAQVFRTPFAGWIIALYTLPIALFLAMGSRGVVRDVGVIVTLYGWLALVKCSLYLLCPQLAQKLGKSPGLTPTRCKVAGVGMCMLGGIVGAALIWPAAFGR